MKKTFRIMFFEVLIAFLLIAAAATFGFYYLGRGFIENKSLKNAAVELADDISAYRGRASTENRMYQIVFSPAANNYRVQQCEASDKPDQGCSGGWNDIMLKSLSAFGNGISFDETVPAFQLVTGQPTIKFYPSGIVIPSCMFCLRNSRGSRAEINIASNGKTYVDWKDLK